MKKLLLIFCSVIVLSACGSSESTNSSDSKTSNSTEKQESESAAVANKEEEVVEETKTPALNLNEVLVLEDFAEITVKSNTFGKVINPPSPGSFYSYYENKEDDQIYLDTVISIKSLLTSAKSSDEFADVKIVYDNKYEYNSFSIIEDQGGADFTYTNITGIEPLQTGTIHFLSSVPVQVESDGKPLKAVITVNGETYEQIIR